MVVISLKYVNLWKTYRTNCTNAFDGGVIFWCSPPFAKLMTYPTKYILSYMIYICKKVTPARDTIEGNTLFTGIFLPHYTKLYNYPTKIHTVAPVV